MNISVAMCTYNGASYLREQLQSITAQIRPPDELVICDDRSSDSTVEIIRNFAAQSPFPVKFFINEQTIGSTKNFERAVTYATGEIIALADQDDVWKPEKLGLIEAEFESRPELGLIFSDAEIVDENLRSTGRRMWSEVGLQEREKDLIRRGRGLEVLMLGWSVTGATMAFRSRYRDLALPIPAGVSMIHDGWIALMIAAVAEVDLIDKPLIMYRQHADQQIGAPQARSQAVGRTKSLAALKEAAHRANSYASLVQTIETVKERLSDKEVAPAWQRNSAYLDSWLKHMRTRMNLPSGILARASAVLREFLAMRYHRYANGATSAAKDLIYGARQP
jgi:glycosyl transferase family 2